MNANRLQRALRPPATERTSRQRAAVIEAITVAARPLAPAEILAAARLRVPSVSLATVYRNLKRLQDDGLVQPILLPGESPRYESAERHRAHHHHFQCTACERVFDVPGCADTRVAFTAPKGFAVERHEVTLYGRCRDCGKRAATPAR